MNVGGVLIIALVAIAFAMGFTVLGMALATRYNQIAWKKYYEGRGERSTAKR